MLIPAMLISAIVAITTAFIFYTIAVWSEKIQGVLKLWHFVLFTLGLMFDTTGTYMMRVVADNSGGSGNILHSITGLLAIVLMIVHTVWAGYVLKRGTQHQKESFHKYSIIVWFIWLIPFLSGMMMNM